MHKMSNHKMSNHKMSKNKMSNSQNVECTKCRIHKMSNAQNVEFTKCRIQKLTFAEKKFNLKRNPRIFFSKCCKIRRKTLQFAESWARQDHESYSGGSQILQLGLSSSQQLQQNMFIKILQEQTKGVQGKVVLEMQLLISKLKLDGVHVYYTQ